MVAYMPSLRVTIEYWTVSRLMNPNGSFSILALDGGGVRGIYAAQLLATAEQSLGTKIADCFDLIAGGSSTGSIMAGAAVAEIALTDIVNLFENETASIFRKRSFITDISALWRSRYSTQALDAVLQQYVPHLTLDEISIPLMITSANLATGGVHVFRSAYS